jgi:hypothetical protein
LGAALRDAKGQDRKRQGREQERRKDAVVRSEQLGHRL